MYLDTVAAHAMQGVILSWAKPNQPGMGHVNCQENDWVVEKMKARGFALDEGATAYARSQSLRWWFVNTVLVFHRVS